MMTAGMQTKDGKSHWTTTCLNCGQCEKKCPQGIKIREEFKHVHKDLEGIGTKIIAYIARGIMNKGKQNSEIKNI